MNIFSKQALMSSGKKKYKAYLLFGSTATDVADLGFTEDIDITTTLGTSDSNAPCDLVILNGKLFVYNRTSGVLNQIDSSMGWIDVSGQANSSNYGYGIYQGKLYRIQSSNITQIGNLTSHTRVKGSNPYSAIASGNCYRGINKISGISNCTEVSCGDISKYRGCLVISSGYAYHIDFFDTVTQVNYSQGVKKVSGQTYLDSSNSTTKRNETNALFINGSDVLGRATYNGASILFQPTKFVKDVTGSLAAGTNASETALYITLTGELYALYSVSSQTENTVQIGNLTNWTSVSGHLNNNSTLSAYGIAGTNLYQIQRSSSTVYNVTQIGNNLKPVKIFGCSLSTNYPALAICEV